MFVTIKWTFLQQQFQKCHSMVAFFWCYSMAHSWHFESTLTYRGPKDIFVLNGVRCVCLLRVAIHVFRILTYIYIYTYTVIDVLLLCILPLTAIYSSSVCISEWADFGAASYFVRYIHIYTSILLCVVLFCTNRTYSSRIVAFSLEQLQSQHVHMKRVSTPQQQQTTTTLAEELSNLRRLVSGVMTFRNVNPTWISYSQRERERIS